MKRHTIKSTRINSVMTDDLLAKIDRQAGEMGMSRSLFIREASERYLTEIERQKEAAARKKKMAAAAECQDRLREKGGTWDGVSEIRKWRDKR